MTQASSYTNSLRKVTLLVRNLAFIFTVCHFHILTNSCKIAVLKYVSYYVVISGNKESLREIKPKRTRIKKDNTETLTLNNNVC